MNTSGRSIEDSPLSGFHRRLLAATAGGMLCDGYVLGGIGVALAMAGPDLGLSSWWTGSIGAAALAGIFLGSLVVGRITDRLGRRRLFTLDLVLLLVACLAQLVVTDATQLLVVRLVIGLAVGAEYAIGTALLSEFSPRRARPALLGALNAAWVVGFVLAYLVSTALRSAGASWQVVLASSAVPVAVVLALRWGLPESPRWLITHGRTEEALAVVQRHVGPEYGVDDLVVERREDGGQYRELFSRRYRTRTAFAGIFWMCQVVPLFALTIFLPQALGAVGVQDEFTGSLLVNGALLVGSVAGLWAAARLPRRGWLIWSFLLTAATLAVVGWAGVLPIAVTLTAFVLFVLISSAASDMEYVVPGEVFPTHLRGSGVGLAAATSRIGSAASTFLLPPALAAWGAGPTMAALCGVALVGAAVSFAWAPETSSLSLTEAAGTPGPTAGDAAAQQVSR
ncbi:MFS transporter [Kineococcus sp. SYSU DK001]|uniref:MFS transporter n=1 Tax=Kineococcus sp. SYSU DK001 TaxID=3383122 RepID=UPI003D7EA258